MQRDEPPHVVISYAHGKITVPVRTDDRADAYGVREQSTAELERTRRELRAQVGFVRAGSPALTPVMRHLDAVNAEIDRRIMLAVLEDQRLCLPVVAGTCRPVIRPGRWRRRSRPTR